MDYNIKTIKQIGHALRAIRKENGFTQKEVSSKVKLLPKTVSALEAGSSGSTIESLMKYIAALDCDIIIAPRGNDSKNKSGW